jgi:2,3-diketo-5-methylthio-1-phosphopentane phosphatase
MRIFCDFDGTISTRDTTDFVLSRLANQAWEDLEAQWLDGEITAAACMRGQIRLIEADDQAIDAVLGEVELAEGFAQFVDWCQREALALVVVSDGVDRFIQRILARHDVPPLSIISNMFVRTQSGPDLIQNRQVAGCAAGLGVCKCAVTANTEATGPMVYIGDGRSDYCVAARADILFARDSLADYACSRAMPHHLFTDFHQIQSTLEALRLAQPRRVPNRL